MSLEANKALTLAYKSVIKLGWNHSRICEAYGISPHTLRRIRDGRKVKTSTRDYCMWMFVKIINKAFHEDLEKTGGANAFFFNRTFREILLELFGINEV